MFLLYGELFVDVCCPPKVYKSTVPLSFQQCPSHGEKLSMFCSKNSSLLCMKCFSEVCWIILILCYISNYIILNYFFFSEASLETRLHCVDIDIAYEQRKKSLDLAISVSPFYSQEGSSYLLGQRFSACPVWKFALQITIPILGLPPGAPGQLMLILGIWAYNTYSCTRVPEQGS